MSILVPIRNGWKKLGKALAAIIVGPSKGREWVLAALELAGIAVWALWIGIDYIDFNPRHVPAGREFLSAVQTYAMWDNVKQCGWCALWNGSTSGGYPAFAELYGSPLHPIVGIATWLWGVINGSKVTLLVSLMVGGLAQWWLAHELKLGRVARLWSALAAVAGGHIAGRMELGVLGVALSTGAASLVIPAVLRVVRLGSMRAVVLLAAALASALLAGQGYMQVGLFFLIPALAVLLIDERLRLHEGWKQLLIAAVVAVLLAAPLLVPFAHFSPNFVKDVDPAYTRTQPLGYLVLNLVISDIDYYYTGEMLGKLPYPYLYTLFIGWGPVLLAVYGLMASKGSVRRQVWFLVAGAVILFLVGSGVALMWITPLVPSVAGVRHPSLVAGLAIPMILGVAGVGLDKLLKLDWPAFTMDPRGSGKAALRVVPARWVLLLVLALGLKESFTFASHWLYTVPLHDGVTRVLTTLQTDDLQWVAPPFGEHPFVTPGVTMGLKLSPGIRPWAWEGRQLPLPVLLADRGVPVEEVYEPVVQLEGVGIFKRDDQSYAAVLGWNSRVPCPAGGRGGYIWVSCDSETAGRLVVQENTWSGWKAWRDGEEVPLQGEQWLEVEAPAGHHEYQFVYLPWDVPLGLSLMALGAILCAVLWFRSPIRVPHARSSDDLDPDGLESDPASSETP